MNDRPKESRQSEGLVDRLNNGPIWLIIANAVSYLTSLLRERFLYQHEFGTHSLDVVVVSLAIAAIVGNAIGVALSFWWAAGRISVEKIYVGLAIVASVTAFVAMASPTTALLILYLLASAAFLLAMQRAASVGRQLYALAGAVMSPGIAVLIWASVGVGDSTDILLGYAAAALWQAVGAWIVGQGGLVAASSGTSSLLWPLAYVAAVQVDGVADITLLLLAGRGWASACAFAYNAFSATTVVVIGPLSVQALAGRLHLERPARILGLSTLAAGLFAVLAPFVLRLLLQGGAVVGVGYHRVVVLTLLYAPALPFAIFWQLMSRSEHRDSERWKALAIQATVLVLLHMAFLLLLVVFQAWIYVPLSTVGAFAALAIFRFVSSSPRSGERVETQLSLRRLPRASTIGLLRR